MAVNLRSAPMRTYGKRSTTHTYERREAKRRLIDEGADTAMSPDAKRPKQKIQDYFKPRWLSKTLLDIDTDTEADLSQHPTALSSRTATKQRRRLRLKNAELHKSLSKQDAQDESTLCDSTDLCRASSIRDVRAHSGRVQTQLQLHLSTHAQSGCGVCKFFYNPTIASDREAHDAFHDHFVHGYSVGGLVPDETAHRVKVVDAAIHEDGTQNYVVAVSASSSSYWRTHATNALQIASRDLGAEDIPADALWSTTPPSRAGPHTNPDRTYRYKVFLCVRQRRIKAVLLAEHIDRAVGSTTRGAADTAHTAYDAVWRPAQLGVARLWTQPASRRQGLAAHTLDCARRRHSFIYGVAVARRAVAFSATTPSGSAFAAAYVKREQPLLRCDFLTYFESDDAQRTSSGGTSVACSDAGN